MDNKNQRREAITIFAGFSMLMYLAAAYEYFIGFSRVQRGAIAGIINAFRGSFGVYALFICFFCMGTLFCWLAFIQWRKQES